MQLTKINKQAGTMYQTLEQLNIGNQTPKKLVYNTTTTPGVAAHTVAQTTDKYAKLSNSSLLSLCRGNSWCVA